MTEPECRTVLEGVFLSLLFESSQLIVETAFSLATHSRPEIACTVTRDGQDGVLAVF
jgi:hypothetical protein